MFPQNNPPKPALPSETKPWYEAHQGLAPYEGDPVMVEPEDVMQNFSA